MCDMTHLNVTLLIHDSFIRDRHDLFIGM